jgi:hypothetical protein
LEPESVVVLSVLVLVDSAAAFDSELFDSPAGLESELFDAELSE